MNKFERVLFLGTGGGNDVFSAMLAALALRQRGYAWSECCLAGILSPFHVYSHCRLDASGAMIVAPRTERWLCRKDYVKKVGCVDARVAAMVEHFRIANARPYTLGLPLNRGSEGLAEVLQKLSRVFDCIVLVDIGGDCFYGGPEDTHILSPMFDALVLRAFIDSGVSGFLFEAGPGTDGEMEPERIEAALGAAGAESFPLDAASLGQWGELYQTWIADERPGRTVPVTLSAFHSSEEELKLEYRARAHMGETRLYRYFTQRIKTALCRQFFLVKPQNIRNPFMVRCRNPFEWFWRAQWMLRRTNCEPNLEYLRWGKYLMQFLTPSPLFDSKDQAALLRQGLKELLAGSCDGAWLFPGDWDAVDDELKSAFLVNRSRDLLEVRPNEQAD
jgi:hypothetical protein